jgi:MscS family membrane protein
MRRSVVLALVAISWSAAAEAQSGRFPLELPDTTSPRGTLSNLRHYVAEASRTLEAARRAYESTSGLLKSEEVLAQQARAEALLRRATGSLDLSRVPPATVKHVGLEASILLAEVLDRVPLPPAGSIPDAEAVKAQGLTRWRVPRTAIEIVQVTSGPRSGEFLFSPRTVAQAGTMYRAVRHLPYVSEGVDGLYERYILTPGSLLTPKWLAWVTNLPSWTQTKYYGATLWQWTFLSLTLAALFLVPYLLSRWQRRFDEPRSETLRVLRRLVVPVVALLGLWLGQDFLVRYVTFTGYGLTIAVKVLLIPVTILAAHVSYLVARLVAEIIIRSPQIDGASLDANMIRTMAGLLGSVFGLGIIAYGANSLGLPLIPLVASLGVGGLAVALAARPTLENLIGGIMLYADRPVRVGDFCTFGDKTGTVERIGVRSTQIRARDRTVITVPNALFADMEIINWARCDMMLVRQIIGLRYETDLDQLRYVLGKLREMFVAHPKIDDATQRVRFLGYGSSSLDIEIRVYVLTHEWNEFFAIQEDVMLRVGDIVAGAGTSFAFPSQTLYLGRDGGLDVERGEAAMRDVQSWRSSGTLPFPNMSPSNRRRLADTLDYPPRGSPDADSSEIPSDEGAEPLSTDGESDEQPEAPERR